jgi:hypothetical protein
MSIGDRLSRTHARTANAVVMGTNERDTRYGHRSGSGANQPKDHERKEQRPDWKSRQGGDQTRGDEDRLNPPIDPEEREKLR